MVKPRPRSLQILQPGKGSGSGVLVIHSWWGLTPSFTAYGRQLAQAGFVVGLADLFEGECATTEQQARRLMARPRRQPFYKTLIAAIDELRSSGNPEGQMIGVVGFSMGGHWAIWLSQRPDLPIAAMVLYYAARAGDFTQSRSSYLAHFAENDPWVSKAGRRRMEQAIVKAGRRYEAFDYPGTSHWFAERDRKDAYDSKAAELALARSIAHLKNGLGKRC